MNSATGFTLALLALVALGCGGELPTAPRPESPIGATLGPSGVQAQARTVKVPISGTFAFVGVGAPGRLLSTPSGMCHLWDLPVYSRFDGDIQGDVLFQENQHLTCDRSHLVANGPFGGEITFDGRSGTMAGQWTTNCKADAASPAGLSCDGTMNARGSGGLDGVRFHFKWGPGWWPFTYTGTAFSQEEVS